MGSCFARGLRPPTSHPIRFWRLYRNLGGGAVEKFLISRLSALGDTVCSLPAAVALKRGFPDCHITWIVDPRFAGIVECCEAVDATMTVKPSLKTIPTFDDRFDAALDLQGLLKSALCISKAK